MKTIRKIISGLIVVLTLTLAVPPASAIEGLKLTIRCPDVVLSWPSVEGENYIVQWHETLGTNTPWVTLTNYLPAESGTNLTTFTHSNRVDCPPEQSLSRTSGGSERSFQPDYPLVVPNDGSRGPVPLGIYPPGIDLTGYIILWPDGSTNEWSAELVKSWRALQPAQRDGPQPQDAGGDSAEPDCGFYRVVRVGINLFGITNGMVLSGTVPLRLEFGDPDTNRSLVEVFLTDENDDGTVTGTTFSDLPAELINHLSGVWDTLQVTNGTYTLVAGARSSDGTVYLDHPITVTVSNTIWFPDAWNVGGQGIYIGAQTIFTNGVWHLDVYDDQNSYLGYLDGPVDSNGYCSYPGITGPGFTLNNTDAAGHQNPSTAYAMVFSVGPTNAAPPYAMATNKIFIEPAWNFATRAVICHMNLFSSWQPGWTDVNTLMQAIWNTEEAFHPNLLGGITTPYEVFTLGDWGTVLTKLFDPSARDFFYFGHGSATALGPNTNLNVPITDIDILLQNNMNNPLTATNRHPYRFVFLDGCNTADGNWPQAFGIPKKEGMVITDFTQKRGIRPRAFMGWNRKKVVGTGIVSGGSLHPAHETYITTFWEKWANGMTVSDAIDQAKIAAPNAALGMKLYGAKNLQIYY